MERREMKTSPEQWKVVVEFMEEHPTLLRGKFKHFEGDHEEIKRLWDELSLRLNAMGLGARSADKWQLAIGRWKSKTKAKASQLKIESEKTGGGPGKAAPLNQIEERLMALLGWRSVTGDKNLELGLAPPVPDMTPMPAMKPTPATTPTVDMSPTPSTSKTRTPSPSPFLKQPEQVDDTPPPLTPIKRRVPSQPTTVTRGNTPKTKRSIRYTSEKSRKMVTLSQMHKENQQRLAAIEKNTGNMAAALQSISSDIHMYMNYLMNKD